VTSRPDLNGAGETSFYGELLGGGQGAVINDRGTVVFRADREDGVQGIYAAGEGPIRAVAETGDLFETLAPFPSLDDRGTMAFAATLREGGAGIFSVDEGRINRILETDGAFESCRGALTASTGAVVCIATPRGGGLGLFAGPDPEADRILALGDALLGSTVSDFASNPVSVNAAGQVAIRPKLSDGGQVVLRADPLG
jgi:hypothetical protein